MTDITPQQIAKLAKWAGLENPRVTKDGQVLHGPTGHGVTCYPFAPVNRPGDAWLLLERALQGDVTLTFVNAADGRPVQAFLSELLGEADNPRTALCLAILELLGDE